MIAKLQIPLYVFGLFAADAAMAADNKFDLFCSGASDTQLGGTHTPGEFEQTLHIDLDRGQYCVGTCSVILDLARADPLSIVLVDVPRHGTMFNMRMERRIIDRRSGEYTIFDFDAANTRSLTVKATCSPKPFTPFPTTKF